MYSRVAPVTEPSRLTKRAANGLILNEAAEDMPGLPMGPFTKMADGAIVAVDATESLISRDGGASWDRHPLFAPDPNLAVCAERAILCTQSGVLVCAFMNERELHWTWSDELRDAPGAVLPTYAMRSLDGGITWTDVQKLHDDWTGAIRSMIETRTGRVVFTSMKFLHDPGRHSVLTYASDDDGVTWTASNVLDLGDTGHHGGVTEATICELSDGRLLMYLRTNWSQFWLATSSNGGLHWHSMGPAGVEASSAPGLLLRLASGRIALFWNRPYPEGKTDWPLSGGDGLWSSVPVSNHRTELCVSFSSDECEHWSAPVVVAKHPKDEWIAYPYALEVEPGMLWVTTMQGDLRCRIHEADFLR